MDDAKNIRAFLALDIPAAVLDEIAAIQRRMQKILSGEIRWTNPSGIHLTLKFFGNISEGDAISITGAIGPIAAATKPLPLEIRTAGVFPDARRPRILWLGMGGEANRLVALQATVENALAGLGFAKEERLFRPHLTIARIKSPKGLTGISGLLDNRGVYNAGSFVGHSLTLFRSTLTPKGAVYTELGKFAFQETTP